MLSRQRTLKRNLHMAAILVGFSLLLVGALASYLFLDRTPKDPPKDALLVRKNVWPHI